MLTGGFFAWFFLYFWLRVEPALEYQRATPVFLLHASFFKPFFGYPGGLADYAGAFLAQLNYVSWLGALVYTGLAGAGFFLSWRLLTKISGSVPPVVAFGPGFLLLLSRQGYECPSLAPVLGWGASLGLAWGYARLPWTKAWLRVGGCWGLGAPLFYLTGFWPGLLFAVLAAEFEMARRKWVLGLGVGLSTVGALLAMDWWLDMDSATVMKGWGPGAPRYLFAALYLFVPVLGALLALVPKRAVPSPALPSGAGSEGAPTKASRRAPLPGAGSRGAKGSRKYLWLTADGFALIILILGWAAVWFLFDTARKTRLQVDYYAGRNDYARVLAAAARLPALDAAREVRLHRALYHTGRLGEALFTYTNQTTWNLLASVSRELAAAIPASETLLELGQVNDAEHMAHEALEMEGDRPELLRLLAQVNLLKGRPRAARVFLKVLSRVPFQRAWAREALRMEGNPPAPEDPELARIRGLMPSSDLPHDAMPTEDLLLHLLHRNAQNRMAFEYLMAHYLLARQLDKFAGELKRLEDFKYDGIPRHYEEAILLFQKLQGRAVDVGGRQIRPETRARFEEFAAGVNRGRYEGAAGRQALAREFGKTYWRYFFLPAAASKAGEAPSMEAQ
jgi:tetratricopeptide (TPR) repeat protein